MIIIASREGQLANRIWHASAFIVNAQENNYRIIHPFFDEYYPFFSESLNRNKSPIRFWGKRKSSAYSFLQTLLIFGIKIFLKLNIKKLPFFEIIRYEGYDQEMKPFDLNDENFINKAKSKLVLVCGWLFRDTVNQEKHKQLLLDTWVPDKQYQEGVESDFKKYKNEHDLLIGVHIRGGDYKKFEKGKWYYTPEEYYKKMQEVAALEIFRNKRIAFVVCTNEKNISMPGTEKFSVFSEERHSIEDLYLLAKCDYIMGPPSTFSIWASFYGAVPLLMIKDISVNINEFFFTTNAIVCN